MAARVSALRARSTKALGRRAELEMELVRATRAAGLAFPYDLDKLAVHLGIDEVRRVPLGINGRVVSTGAGRVIEIDDLLTEERARFVLAHELSHLILEASPSFRSTPTSSDDYLRLEADCDAAAAELVAPTVLLGAEFGEQPPSLDDALRFAEGHTIEVQLLLGRLIDLGFWKARAIIWKVELGDAPRFQATWTVPRTNGSHTVWRLHGLSPTDIAAMTSGAPGLLSASIEFAVNELVLVRLQSASLSDSDVLTLSVHSES
jgi:hypothetical protein